MLKAETWTNQPLLPEGRRHRLTGTLPGHEPSLSLVYFPQRHHAGSGAGQGVSPLLLQKVAACIGPRHSAARDRSQRPLRPLPTHVSAPVTECDAETRPNRHSTCFTSQTMNLVRH
jgi:hypothetical protein